jgi:alanine racemase
VDRAALTHNAGVWRRAVPAGTRLGILVKANGYGHGMVVAARAALRGGADQLLVATLDEGLALRSAGIDAPVLVVYGIPADGLAEAAAAGLEISVAGVGHAAAVAAAARSGVAPLRVHVEVDSGMGRGGVPPARLVESLQALRTAGVEVVGLWSHLADGMDAERSRLQIERYEGALADAGAAGFRGLLRHLSATEGVILGTGPAYDMIRIGLGYYGELGLGVEPTGPLAALAAELRPAMSVKARPIRLEDVPARVTIGYGGEWQTTRPSRIATLPIGYADGWTRRYWPGAEAIVRGQRVPLVGRVSMDSVCADVTDVPGVTPEDEVVLLGSQGDERITAADLAALRGSIPNEVFCDFGPRLVRVEVG